MTETRKKIIEIIKDYMDKTPDKGCLFYTAEEDYYAFDQYMCKGSLKEMIGPNKYLGRNSDLDSDDLDNYEVCDCDIYETIGHYDITAVLKYINFIKIKLDSEKLDDGCFQGIEMDIENDFIIGQAYYDYKGHCSSIEIKIPNKPLHLYTEEEDEKLLLLLNKINE